MQEWHQCADEEDCGGLFLAEPGAAVCPYCCEGCIQLTSKLPQQDREG